MVRSAHSGCHRYFDNIRRKRNLRRRPNKWVSVMGRLRGRRTQWQAWKLLCFDTGRPLLARMPSDGTIRQARRWTQGAHWPDSGAGWWRGN